MSQVRWLLENTTKYEPQTEKEAFSGATERWGLLLQGPEDSAEPVLELSVGMKGWNQTPVVENFENA